MKPFRTAAGLLASLVGFALARLAAVETPESMQPEISPRCAVTRCAYHGWTDAVRLSNGLVEVIVVPSIGRVMQFRFAGEDAGPFWENPALAGGQAAPDSRQWANFGGDKVWPAPQAGWPEVIARAWPPPAGFDGLPMRVEITGSSVTLISAVDSALGVQTRRRIELSPGRSAMTITTTFEKTAGNPVAIGVWVITQVKDPVAVFAIPADSVDRGGAYVRLSDEAPPDLKLGPDWISLTRDPARNHKIGLRSGTLLWVDRTDMLRIDSALTAGGEYPDGGSSAEIYTNADPLAYVELELLGPLAQLKVGDKIEQVATYTLARRTGPDPEADVRRVLAQ
jgi:hypothetical protein